MSRHLMSADEVIQDIAATLAESDGEFIEEIANRVLSGRVEYIEDSLFEVFWDDDDDSTENDGLTTEEGESEL